MEAKNDNLANLALNLRYLINETGLKDYEIATRLGIHRVTLSRILTCDKYPSRQMIDKICRYFGVEYDDLVYGCLLPYYTNSENDNNDAADLIAGGENPKERETVYFAQNLRYYINRTGLSNYEVAERIGVHRVSLSRLMTDGHIPRKSVLEKIARYFSLSPHDMVYKNLMPRSYEVPTTSSQSRSERNHEEEEWKERALKAEKKLDELKNVLLILADNTDTIRRILLDE